MKDTADVSGTRSHATSGRRTLSVLSSLAMMIAGLTGAGLAVPAPASGAALPTGDGVSYTLEGCRNNGDISLPDGSGKFLCPDASYTTGNLGKGWNELDLVPIRVTVKAGNSAPATQNFTFAIAVDNCSNGTGATGCATGRPGYDVLSSDSGGTPVKNTALSTGTCGTVSASGQLYQAPGVGGTGTTLYRTVSITGQAKNSTCVYDAFARLALGSHLYPGASLHFNLTDSDLGTSGVGARDVSLPVNEILPQSLRKDMSASEGSAFAWSVTKDGSSQVDLGDTCGTGGSGTATITVTWTKHAATPGMISITTDVYAVNPASRPIDVSISDNVYGNQTSTGSALYSLSGSGTVAANSTAHLISDTREVPAGSSTDGYVSDVANATYTDNATGIPVPGNTTTSVAVLIASGTSSQDTAVVTDDEWWSVADPAVSFSVATPSIGSFTNYTAGTSVSGSTHVGWSSGTVNDSGSVTFTKTVTGAQGANANATLSDIATVTPAGGTGSNSNQLDIPVSVATTVGLNLTKIIPDDLTGSESVTFDFTAKDALNATVGTPSVTFTAGQTSKTVTAATGLEPGTYTVSETDAPHYAHQTDKTATVLGDTDAHCTGGVTFINTHGPATAKATKVSDPAGFVSGWHFLLNGPGITAPGEDVVTDATGVATFTTALLQGTYTITEVAQAGWDQTHATAGCTFTVNYPGDADRTFDGCVITNTQRGALKVHKTVVANDSGSTLSDTFSICILGPSYPSVANCKTVGIAGGDVTWTNLLPGGYTVSEAPPGSPWIVSIDHTSVTVDPGSTASVALSTVTNTRKGKARVIKTVSAHDGSNPVPPSGTDSFTFTLRSGATNIIGHPGTILDTEVANAGNGGQFDFTPLLVPGNHYQVCEMLPDAGWTIELGAGQFVPEQYLADGVTLNPAVVNNVYCLDFVAQPGPDPTVFHVNNRRPPGGSALTIGYWKNWASCTKSASKQKNSLDQTLYLYGANGLVVSATSGGWPIFGPTYYLQLVAGSNPNVAIDCSKAVSLLNKSTFTGKKLASDPAFNLAAQLVAAELNYKAGAATTVTAQINQAVLLLGKYQFDGNTHTNISKADAAIMNALATALDHYNNNV
jgi:hypothetical protein